MMVVPNYPYPVAGGLEKQAHELAKALLEQNIEVQIISGQFTDEQAYQELVDGVLVHRIPWAKQKWLRFISVPFYLLSTLFRMRNSFDVVHLHQFSWFSLYTLVLASILKKPVLTKLPNVGELGIPGLKKQALGSFKLAMLLKSDAIVAMSKQSIEELNSVKFPMTRTLVTPNGISIDVHRKIKYRSECCKVVFVGRLVAQKGVIDLLHVWKDIVHEYDNVELEIWGNGELKKELLTLSDDLGINDSIVFRDHVTEVPSKLKDMDIFVLPSYSEGNSNAILEAMAVGLPIISTDIGGTAMLVGEEGGRLLYKAGDRDMLRKHLSELVGSEETRKELGKKMHSRVLKNFDINHIAETYVQAYSLLCSQRQDSVCELRSIAITEHSEHQQGEV